ncbi:PREDICTED: uncharacterized protein LOC106893722 [Calidris pugnax]|uniref:uncharacterized protein LOC106893722 n=1 Tax=Calidris pugnax TaxID=198806 RepID=UPI00071E64B2|nr:PREDICTED: uncharacterized protein LOC106893722 [Calidris pugnax]
MAQQNLYQLLDLAIGTPNNGAVNFTALRILLLAMLGHLRLRDLAAQKQGDSVTPLLEEDQPSEAPPALQKEGDKAQGTGQQPQEPKEQLPSKDSLSETTSGPQLASVATEVGWMKDEIKAPESGISKATALPQDLLEEIGATKAARSHMKEEIQTMQEALGLLQGKRQDTASQLPGHRNQKRNYDEVWPESGLGPAAGQEKRLKERLKLSPIPEEEDTGLWSAPSKLPQVDVDSQHGASSTPGPKGGPVPSTSKATPGTQPGSDATQAGTRRAPGIPEKVAGTPSDGRRASDASAVTPEMQPGSSSAQLPLPGMEPALPGIKIATPGEQPGSRGTQSSSPRKQPVFPSTQLSPPGMEPALPGIKIATPGEPPELPRSQTLSLEVQPGSPDMSHLQVPAMPWESSPSGRASDYGVVTVEALHHFGQLKEQVSDVGATKSDYTEDEDAHLLFPEGDEESVALWGQEFSLQSLASDLQEMKEKIRQLEDALGKLWVSGADRKAESSYQIALQLGSVLKEVKEEVMELKGLGLQEMKQEVLELKDLELEKMKRELKELGEHQDITEATLKQLRTEVAERTQAQQDKLKTIESVGQEKEGIQAACPVCPGDTGAQLGQLLQRYEKLQELVDSLMSQQAVGKAVRQLQKKSQQEKEVLKGIQTTIVQVQGNYEQLNTVMETLLHDSQQQQKDTDALFQSLEKLAKEKADKNDLVLGLDVKADKTTLAGKVNRSEFDTRMERLTETVKEMLSRQMDQEKVQQQLSEEVASKLDHTELGAFRKQLEGHWKNIQKQLQKESRAEADDAAGTKSQLTHHHCLSCDRPRDMRVPGPQIVTVPSLPPLSPCLAEPPSTTPRLEQGDQQGHREPPVEGKYPTVPRSCGGRHTVTIPLQRRQGLLPPRRLQPLMLPNKCNMADLLAKDSRTSRVQLDEPVPAGKEGPAEHQPRLHKPASSHHLSYTPRPPRDRPSTRAARQGQLLVKQ